MLFAPGLKTLATVGASAYSSVGIADGHPAALQNPIWQRLEGVNALRSLRPLTGSPAPAPRRRAWPNRIVPPFTHTLSDRFAAGPGWDFTQFSQALDQQTNHDEGRHWQQGIKHEDLGKQTGLYHSTNDQLVEDCADQRTSGATEAGNRANDAFLEHLGWQVWASPNRARAERGCVSDGLAPAEWYLSI